MIGDVRAAAAVAGAACRFCQCVEWFSHEKGPRFRSLVLSLSLSLSFSPSVRFLGWHSGVSALSAARDRRPATGGGGGGGGRHRRRRRRLFATGGGTHTRPTTSCYRASLMSGFYLGKQKKTRTTKGEAPKTPTHCHQEQRKATNTRYRTTSMRTEKEKRKGKYQKNKTKTNKSSSLHCGRCFISASFPYASLALNKFHCFFFKSKFPTIGKVFTTFVMSLVCFMASVPNTVYKFEPRLADISLEWLSSKLYRHTCNSARPRAMRSNRTRPSFSRCRKRNHQTKKQSTEICRTVRRWFFLLSFTVEGLRQKAWAGLIGAAAGHCRKRLFRHYGCDHLRFPIFFSTKLGSTGWDEPVWARATRIWSFSTRFSQNY